MPHYETVLILRQDLSNSQAESIASKTQQELKKAKATIDRAESWGLRTLAYPIRKNRKGHYFIINHSNESQTTQEMQRVLRLNEDLLRILTIKTTLPQTQPTPIATAQAQREPETTTHRTTERSRETQRESSRTREPQEDNNDKDSTSETQKTTQKTTEATTEDSEETS